ncbi:hypothetical protein ACFVFS_00625 [Kitasatospora sp. NPDC057692]|uniref:hypothetical protein n=1 Tax=Kitasatospora sp. NPDC057692 TaxID=3346215 RepID=UPI0036D00443
MTDPEKPLRPRRGAAMTTMARSVLTAAVSAGPASSASSSADAAAADAPEGGRRGFTEGRSWDLGDPVTSFTVYLWGV